MRIPLSTETSFTPDTDLDRSLCSIKVRWEWPGQDEAWDRFRLVRRMNSPAGRCEEGAVLFETKPEDWGDPVYDDLAAPPGKWVYYSAFVLLVHSRIWVKVGDVYDIATGDYDWTMNLPESLPGVAVSKGKQVAAKADVHHELVEFLQGPGLILDRVMSYAESAQHFWDPTKVPPDMLPALLNTLGFNLSDTLSAARLREVAYSLLVEWPQGSLRAIESFVRAATNYPTYVQISNNKMLSVLDSSFESTDQITGTPPLPPGTPSPPPDSTFGTYQEVLDYFLSYATVDAFLNSYSDLVVSRARTTGSDPLVRLARSNWEPLDKNLIELRRYENFPNPPSTLPVEVLDTFFLHFKKAGWIACGRTNPTRQGIPVSAWELARGGVFARSAVGARLNMYLDLFDFDNAFLRTVPLITTTTLTTNWQWIHTPRDNPIAITEIGESLLSEPDAWYGTWPDRAEPQNKPHIINRNGEELFSFEWDTDPNPAGNIVDQPDTALLARLAPVPAMDNVNFRWEMAGTNDPDMTKEMTPWRQVIMWRDTTTAPSPNTYQTILDSHTDYQDVLSHSKTYMDVYTYAPAPASLGGSRTTYHLFHGPWMSPQPETFTAELRWSPPSGVTDAWWGIEVLKPEVALNIYQRTTDENATYNDLSTKFPLYQNMTSDPPRFGWSKGVQHLALHAEIRAGVSGRPYWGVPVIQVNDEADIDLVVVDDVYGGS